MRIYFADHIWRYCLLSLICLLFNVQQTLGVHAKGPLTVVLNVDPSKGSNGVLSGVGKLNLYCQAVLDVQSKRAIPIKSAIFRYGTQKFEAKLTNDSYNATLVREKSPATETGTWKCDLQTTYGNASGKIMVYVRPVINSNSSLRVDEKEGSRTRFDVSGLTIVRGEKAELKCPVYGDPKPEIIWRLANDRQILGSGETLTLNNVDDQNDGTYVCTATNTIFANGQRQKYELVVERRLRIKSELAWLLPLIIILVILVLLVVTIVFCEFRKRHNEQKLIVDEE